MTAPETKAREAIIEFINKEFKTEGFVARDDKLSPSLGADGTYIGVSPVRRIPWSKDYQVNRYEILIQFYGRYQKEVNPTQSVSPKLIEEYADRFCKIFEGNKATLSGAVWFFTLERLLYPPDPTGNSTRFEAHLVCW